jgi:hypothetical protein
MHDVAVPLIPAQQVGIDLAESVGEKTLVKIFYGLVNIFFRG